MTVICGSCKGPAEQHESKVEGYGPVMITVCIECDCIRCKTCKVLVTSRHSVRCPHGHVL